MENFHFFFFCFSFLMKIINIGKFQICSHLYRVNDGCFFVLIGANLCLPLILNC